MSLNIDLYRSRLDAYKVKDKDGVVDSIKKQIINNFYNNPSYFSVLVNDVERDVHIITDLKGQNKLLCMPDELISVGDSVYWEGQYYLCIDADNDNTVQSKGYIQKCNNVFINQAPDTIIYTIPCIITDRASIYSDGVEDNKYLRLPDGLIKIVIPNNKLTNTFDLVDKRIIFDHSKDSVYLTTKAGKLLKKGLIEIIAEVTGYDSTKDNLELNLSNYIVPDESAQPEIPENPSEENYIIQIIGQDSINVIINGVYTTKVYNNGVEVDKEIRFEISNITLATIKSQDGKGCVVVANPNFKLGEVKLKAILVEDETVFTEKIIAVTGL